MRHASVPGCLVFSVRPRGRCLRGSSEPCSAPPLPSCVLLGYCLCFTYVCMLLPSLPLLAGLLGVVLPQSVRPHPTPVSESRCGITVSLLCCVCAVSFVVSPSPSCMHKHASFFLLLVSCHPLLLSSVFPLPHLFSLVLLPLLRSFRCTNEAYP